MEITVIILAVIVVGQFFEIWGLKRDVRKLNKVANMYLKEKSKEMVGQLGNFLESIFKGIDECDEEAVVKVNKKNNFNGKKINEAKEAGAVR